MFKARLDWYPWLVTHLISGLTPSGRGVLVLRLALGKPPVTYPNSPATVGRGRPSLKRGAARSAIEVLQPSRLETRTKESNMYASQWAH